MHTERGQAGDNTTLAFPASNKPAFLRSQIVAGGGSGGGSSGDGGVFQPQQLSLQGNNDLIWEVSTGRPLTYAAWGGNLRNPGLQIGGFLSQSYVEPNEARTTLVFAGGMPGGWADTQSNQTLPAGGGGGASQSGQNGTGLALPSSGGVGVAIQFDGQTRFLGGGGGGGGPILATGQIHLPSTRFGGGQGAAVVQNNSCVQPLPGSPNTGGGGGGGVSFNTTFDYAGANGGSGIVIIRYRA